MTAPPLRIPLKHWRSRWLQVRRGISLHRVASIEWECDQKIGGAGATVCGRTGRLHMPGFFSRMDAPRCHACCKALGIPKGTGAPYNALKGKAKNA